MLVDASADFVKEQQDVIEDDENLLELGVLRPKERISDVCVGGELSSEQQNEIMGVLGKLEKTSMIEHRVHLVDDCPIGVSRMHCLMLCAKRFRR